MTVSLKAIPTEYNGQQYRSRAEARWAVFFDALAIPFEYEPEGYDLGDGVLYLPDFWLPEQRVWVEIKGERPSELETDKARRLALGSGFDAFIFFGGFPSGDEDTESAHKLYGSDGGWDSEHRWCECPVCGVLGIQYIGRSDRLRCRHEVRGIGVSPRLVAAYARARTYQFWTPPVGRKGTVKPRRQRYLDIAREFVARHQGAAS